MFGIINIFISCNTFLIDAVKCPTGCNLREGSLTWLTVLRATVHHGAGHTVVQTVGGCAQSTHSKQKELSLIYPFFHPGTSTLGFVLLTFRMVLFFISPVNLPGDALPDTPSI